MIAAILSDSRLGCGVMTAFSRQFVLRSSMRGIRSRGNDKYSRTRPIPPCPLSRYFMAREREKRGNEREKEREQFACVHFARSDNARVARPTCRQWVGMNDLQALKCMNEQPERNVRLDGARMRPLPPLPSSSHPQLRTLANLWLQSGPMHPPRHVKLLLSGFLTPRSLTREQFRVLIALHSPICATAGEIFLHSIGVSSLFFDRRIILFANVRSYTFHSTYVEWFFWYFIIDLRYLIFDTIGRYNCKIYEWKTNYRREYIHPLYILNKVCYINIFCISHFWKFILSYIFNFIFINYIFDELHL